MMAFVVSPPSKENEFNQQPQRQEPPSEEHKLSSLRAEWVYSIINKKDH